MKHTPGPWLRAGTTVYALTDGRTQRNIFTAQVQSAFQKLEAGKDELEANAQLMSAAPEMLEALKDVMHLIDTGWLVRDISNDDQPGFAMRQLKPLQTLANANAAIEKAES